MCSVPIPEITSCFENVTNLCFKLEPDETTWFDKIRSCETASMALKAPPVRSHATVILKVNITWFWISYARGRSMCVLHKWSFVETLFRSLKNAVVKLLRLASKWLQSDRSARVGSSGTRNDAARPVHDSSHLLYYIFRNHGSSAKWPKWIKQPLVNPQIEINEPINTLWLFETHRVTKYLNKLLKWRSKLNMAKKRSPIDAAITKYNRANRVSERDGDRFWV